VGQEIERKFLVRGDAWREGAVGTVYRQGYLSTVKERTVRVLTVKGITVGATRSEFEYEIPQGDAERMLDDLCERPLIEKTRFVVASGGHDWEVDEFAGENAGLIVAEVELEAEDEVVELPSWAGEEVTADPRYYNANLIAHPFSRW